MWFFYFIERVVFNCKVAGLWFFWLIRKNLLGNKFKILWTCNFFPFYRYLGRSLVSNRFLIIWNLSPYFGLFFYFLLFCLSRILFPFLFWWFKLFLQSKWWFIIFNILFFLFLLSLHLKKIFLTFILALLSLLLIHLHIIFVGSHKDFIIRMLVFNIVNCCDFYHFVFVILSTLRRHSALFLMKFIIKNLLTFNIFSVNTFLITLIKLTIIFSYHFFATLENIFVFDQIINYFL